MPGVLLLLILPKATIETWTFLSNNLQHIKWFKWLYYFIILFPYLMNSTSLKRCQKWFFSCHLLLTYKFTMQPLLSNHSSHKDNSSGIILGILKSTNFDWWWCWLFTWCENHGYIMKHFGMGGVKCYRPESIEVSKATANAVIIRFLLYFKITYKHLTKSISSSKYTC